MGYAELEVPKVNRFCCLAQTGNLEERFGIVVKALRVAQPGWAVEACRRIRSEGLFLDRRLLL